MNWKMFVVKWAPRIIMLAAAVCFWDCGNWTV